MLKSLSLAFFFLGLPGAAEAQPLFSDMKEPSAFALAGPGFAAVILADSLDFTVVQKAAALFREDMKKITGKEPGLANKLNGAGKNVILIGSLERSSFIKKLVAAKKLDAGKIRGKWEAFQVQLVKNPFPGIEQALVIAGSDRRGTAYGVLELSRRAGVSPWYWWADVPVRKQPALYMKLRGVYIDSPRVKYRGIFINDEAPALSNWTREKFGGFRHPFYEKVFELMLRLKSNYIWPAMWGNAFYDDDSLNIRMAEDYAIVIGTSHHEPLMRAHDEWRRYGTGKWNYDSNAATLRAFWKGGLQRAGNEKIVTVGMRGDGDEPMTRETATALLEKIVKDQRHLIEEVTGKSAEATPQLWALYKEVQDYYDKGMRVPDDVTLLLCDDNWGNIRKLPKPREKSRKGGYGIYYHFDYVGGPRNYKWVNTNPIPRIWEQMHLAWQYGARQIWIVNVGDIKPMEFPVSFFLDYAWNPPATGADDLGRYTENWAAGQFGKTHAKEIAEIISTYSKYNGRRKPELLDENTYHPLNYNEARRVTDEYNNLLALAEKIQREIPSESRDAYFQLVLHPVKACSNLQELYTTVAMNRLAAQRGDPAANRLAAKARELYLNDSLITLAYHRLGNGKWNHMMSQTHIGYTYWQQPLTQKMPRVDHVPEDSAPHHPPLIEKLEESSRHHIPPGNRGNLFYQLNGYVSIDASHFSRAVNTLGITWKILPDHGKTGSAITPFPVTAMRQAPGGKAPHVQYDIFVKDTGEVKVHAYFSPTLNIHNDEGLHYALSIDEEEPQVININKDDNKVPVWSQWVSQNIIIKKTTHRISRPGKHVLKYWMVNPAVVLQKLVVDYGTVLPSYLGPPETLVK